MPIKLLSYTELIAKAKEVKDEALAPTRSRSMRKKAELKQLELEEDMISLEAEIQELTAEYPIEFDKVFDKMDKYALKERRHKQFALLIEEMFPKAS